MGIPSFLVRDPLNEGPFLPAWHKFFFDISAHADGGRRGRVVDSKAPNDAVSPETFLMPPSDLALTIGTRRQHGPKSC